MRLPNRRPRVLALLAGLAAVAPLALAGSAAASPGLPRAAIADSSAGSGTIRGFASGDFAFLDALSEPKLNLVQASLAQSAAGVSNGSLQTTDTLGQDLLTTKSASGGNAFARGAGVSLNLGQADETVPQTQLTEAEAVSAPRNSMTTKVTSLALSRVAKADVQPDSAAVNTSSDKSLCVLGKPLSEGTSTIANASVLPGAGSTIASAETIRDDSTERLDPNGDGRFGLSSVATLDPASITLFGGVSGAAITIKVIDPLILRAFASGVSGTAGVTYGSRDGHKNAVSITAGGKTTTLTVEQLFGGSGVVIPVGSKSMHLLDVTIGGKPTSTTASDGTAASAVADLVRVAVVDHQGPTSTTLGGPLSSILTPVLRPAVKALDGFADQIAPRVQRLHLKQGVDLRIGHFEANAEVPSGGVTCGLPVTKTTSKDPVRSGEHFTTTIRTDNPYDCVAKQVRVDDAITATPGVTWTVEATRPKADTATTTEAIWDDIGSIESGGHRDVEVDIAIDPGSAPGEMSDLAHVTATCGTDTVAGDASLHAPQVNPSTSPAGDTLPDTGMSAVLPIGGGLLLAAGLGIAVIRRRVV